MGIDFRNWIRAPQTLLRALSHESIGRAQRGPPLRLCTVLGPLGGSVSIYQPLKPHARKRHFPGIQGFKSLDECSMRWVGDV